MVTNEDLAQRMDEGFKHVQETLNYHERRFLVLEKRETERREKELIERGRQEAMSKAAEQVFSFTWKQAGVMLSAIGIIVALFAALVPAFLR